MVETRTPVEVKEWLSTGERILLTGHTGLVGHGVVEAALGKDELIGLSRGQTKSPIQEGLEAITLDLLDVKELFKVVEEARPSIVLHLAAATNVDACQKDPAWAEKMNIATTGHVVSVCKDLGIPLIHFSTDYVFPRSGGPFSESDNPDPLKSADGKTVNVYGLTKWRAEQMVASRLPVDQRIVVRIVSPYDHRYKAKTGTPPLLFKLLREGRAIEKAVVDATTTYTYVPDIALALNAIIRERLWEREDVIHIANSSPKQLSAFDVADIASRHLDTGSTIKICTLEEFFSPEQAPRPLEGGLRSNILPELGVRMRGWEEVLTQEILPSLPRGRA